MLWQNLTCGFWSVGLDLKCEIPFFGICFEINGIGRFVGLLWIEWTLKVVGLGYEFWELTFEGRIEY